MRLRRLRLLMFLGLFYACKKDATLEPLPCGWVHSNPYKIYVEPLIQWTEDWTATSARFNPNNPNQFAYLEFHGTWHEKSLIVYDMTTGTKTTLATNVAPSDPSWSVKDWILFQGFNDYQIWKVKPNGDSLIRITHAGASYYPEWSPDGTHFVSLYDAPRSGFRSSVIRDHDGNITDTVWGGGAKKWSPDGDKLALAGSIEGPSYVYINSPKNVITIPYSDDSDGPGMFVLGVWTPDSRSLIWSRGGEKLYITEIATSETTLLVDSQECVSQGDFDVSPYGTHLLITEIEEFYVKDKHTINKTSRLVLHNMITQEKMVIFD